MMRKHAFFLTFIASVYAMQRYEIDDEYPEDCVNSCIEKEEKKEEIQQIKQKNPSNKSASSYFSRATNFFKSAKSSPISKTEPTKTTKKTKSNTWKKRIKKKRSFRKESKMGQRSKNAKISKRSKKKSRRRLQKDDEDDEEVEDDYDENDDAEEESDEVESNSDDEYDVRSDSNESSYPYEDEYNHAPHSNSYQRSYKDDFYPASNSKYQKKCEQKCNSGTRKFARKVGQKVEERIGDVNNLLDEAFEEGAQIVEREIVEGVKTLATKFMKTVTADDTFENKVRPYGMFLQNQYEGLTMVYQNFEALSGQLLEFTNLSKSEGSTDEHKVEYEEVAAVKLSNTKSLFRGVSGTFTIEIFEGENKITTLEVYIENPYAGEYKCCVTEVGEEKAKCKNDKKKKITSKAGFTILKEPQWKKFEKRIRFCRIAISGEKTKIPPTPNAVDLIEERSSSDDEENEIDEAE
jgi:hypothetical protein